MNGYVASVVLWNGIISAGEEVLSNEAYAIINRGNGFSLDVRDARREALTIVQTAGFGKGANREWTFTRVGPNVYAIKAAFCGSYLDIRGREGQGARLQLGDAGFDANNRHFILRRSPDGFFTLAAEHSNLLLDVVEAGGWKAEVQTAGRPEDAIQTNREWLIVPSNKLDSETTFSHDRRVFHKVEFEVIRGMLGKSLSNGFVVRSIGIGEGNRKGVAGLRCELQNADLEGVIVLQPRSWPQPEVHIGIELMSTRAFDFFVELGKALTNADEEIRRKVLPPIEARLNEDMKAQFAAKLPQGVRIDVIGVQPDGLVLVSSRFPTELQAQAAALALRYGK